MHNIFSIPIGVHLLLIKNDQILFTKRHNTGYADGLWSLPAGKIEGKETARQALCREAYEELGIIIDPVHLQFRGLLHKIEHDNYENIAMFFVADMWSGQIINQEPHKCAATEFFAYTNLPTPLSPYIAHFFDTLFVHNKSYGEYVTLPDSICHDPLHSE